MNEAPDNIVTRHEFLRLTMGIVAGLGIPGVRAADSGTAVELPVQPLKDDYLAKGLTAMARAKTWFDAHWGAGILAGYYLCRDHPLNAATVAGIRKQMDTVMEVRRGQFVPMNGGRPQESLIDEVPKALLPAIKDGLRAHGHAVIFASLATRALRDAPQMATEEIIGRLCGLSHQIAKMPPEKPAAPTAGYADAQEMIEATFDSLVRFKSLLGHPSVRRPNFTHMVTHAEALVNLEMMGFAELARAGYTGHRMHISAPVPPIPGIAPWADTRSSLESVMSGAYWSDATNIDLWKRKWVLKDNPNGDWIASGHLFKVLYSYHRLMKRIADADKVRLCSAILLERYVNPSVQGG